MISAWLLGPGALENKPDVVYVYNLVTLKPVYKKLRRKFGCPIVLDVQDLWPESVANSGMMQKPALLSILTKWSRDAYLAADHVTALSPGFKQNLLSRGVKPEKVDVVYNWAPEGIAPVEPDVELFNKFGLKDSEFHIMFAGTMGPAQDLDPVLEAAKKCAVAEPSIRFLFLGGGIDEERLKKRVVNEAIGNVSFLPRQPMDEMGKVLACADALLVHLRDEPLFRITIPSKTQAYLAAGIPILMAMKGDAADLVSKSGGGILAEPSDADSIVAAAIQLARKPCSEMKEMGRKGREFYVNELSTEVGVRRFEQIFSALVGGVK